MKKDLNKDSKKQTLINCSKCDHSIRKGIDSYFNMNNEVWCNSCYAIDLKKKRIIALEDIKKINLLVREQKIDQCRWYLSIHAPHLLK